MPRIRLTKSAIDALPTSTSDVVYWDAGYPGFGVKVTPKGRKVFIVLYRTARAGLKLRKYTIGPYGRVTLQQARVAAQRVFAAKLEGRDPAAEKRAARRRIVADRVEDLLETFIAQRLSQNRSAGEIARLLRREIGKAWAGRSIHEISKRDVVEVITAIEQRGAPVAANKTLKSIKTFLRWCVGRAVLDQSPAEGVPLPSKEVAATVCSMTRSSPGLSSPLDRLAVRTVASLNSSRSPASAVKRWPVCSGRNSTSRAEFGQSPNHGRRMPGRTWCTSPGRRWPW
jgi:Arm domain-containing DNA-binding protein/integrase-like protein